MAQPCATRAALAFVCLCLSSNSVHSAPVARFVPFVDFTASAISADGQIVAGVTREGPSLWTQAGGIESFPLPREYHFFNVPNLSGDGTTLVGSLQIGSGLDQRNEAFRWTRETGYQPLGRFSSDWLDRAYATDVSYDGSVVVGTNDTPDGRRAFRWTQSTGQINLGTLGSRNPIYPPFSDASAVSADGSLVVGYVTTSEDEFYKAFRWTESGGYDVIGLPPVVNPSGVAAGGASRISDDGSVIAGISQLNGFDAWTWTEQTGFTLLTPGESGNTAQVSGMSFDGSTIVGGQIVWNQTNQPNGVIYNAVLWRKTTSGYEIRLVEDLLEAAGIDIMGWHLTGAWDVSADGQTIIGEGFDPSGARRSWYAVLPIPEPNSLTYLGTALAAMMARPRRRTSA